jgi:hypothetical protein
LHLAMTLDHDLVAKHVTPIDSSWDGEMMEEFKTWGYNAPPPPPPPPSKRGVEESNRSLLLNRNLKRGEDGMNVIREHIMRAKL